MDIIKEEYIVLNKKNIPRLNINGFYWYPLTYFFKNALERHYKAKDFVDTQIDKYMQVISYKFPNARSENRTWFINEEGLKKILKNIKTGFNCNDDREYKKDLLLDEACILFKVKRKNKQTIYSKIDYTKLDYGWWLKDVFYFDNDLNEDTIWKFCPKCQRYFPNNNKYFGSHKSRQKNLMLHSTCKECENKEIICDNEDINKIKNNCNSWIINEYINKNYYEVFKYFVKDKKGYNLSIFNDMSIIIPMIEKIKEDKNFDLSNYYLLYFSQSLDIPLNILKSSAEIYNLKIGINYPLIEDKKKSLKKITKKETITLFNKTFKLVIKPDKLSFLNCNPVLGVVTPKGLNIICCKDMPKSSRINYYKFSNYDIDMQEIIKKIKKQGGTK